MSIVRESPVLLVVGTRPEGIKMAPVYHALKRAGIPTLLCSTMQHGQLLDDVLELFGIVPDIDLRIMRPGQDLFYVTQAALQKTKEVFVSTHPCLVLVQGDTTTAMAASMAAFYLGIPVAHVEAGLRTDDVHFPFPEEMNRRLISMVSTYHFAPTPAAVGNLLAHGVRRDQVFCTGNTVVDALEIIREKIRSGTVAIREDIRQRVAQAKEDERDIVLLTVHRRESLAGPIAQMLSTIKAWMLEHPHTLCFYPYHPNPAVVEAIVTSGLSDLPNIYLCEPVAYKELVYLLDAADYVLTDSGGIQEEAVSLGKPVLVLRDKTERMEGVLLGKARVVGGDAHAIREGMEWIQNQRKVVHSSLSAVYGDGHAAEKIVAFIQSRYDQLQHKTPQVITHEQLQEPIKRDVIVKKVCILGLGYIGLPTALVAAQAGYEVLGVDIDEHRVAEINKGNPIIHEPEAYEKLHYALGAHLFRASLTVEPADYFIIAVPTPILADKKADLSYVMSATESIVPALRAGSVVIVESTVPVGATQKVADYLSEKSGMHAGVDFFVAHCPERVLPGHIFYELVANDRIIGGINQESVEPAKQFYKQFVSGKLYLTSAEAAEMVKLVENSSRDVQLAFAHQVASMATSIGLNPYEVIKLANKHPRVNILRPTVGVGGHCIAVDPWFLVESFPEHTELIKTAREVNDAKPHEVIACIEEAVHAWRAQNSGACKVLLMGISYKPNIEDLRESPALEIAQHFVKQHGIQALICDPHVDSHVLEELFGNSVVSATDGIERADIVAFLVAHDRFRLIDKKILHTKQIHDFCGVFQWQAHQVAGDEELFWPAYSTMDFFSQDQTKSTHENDIADIARDISGGDIS